MDNNLQLNYLLPSKASLDFGGNKVFSLNVQQFKIPRLYGYVSEQPTPHLSIPIRGNKMVYDLLEVSFIVTENLESWIEIHKWMRELYSPKHTSEYKNKTQEYEEAVLTIYSSKNNPILTVKFLDIFPVRLDEVIFDVEEPNTDPVKTKIEFAYMNFDIEYVNQ